MGVFFTHCKNIDILCFSVIIFSMISIRDTFYNIRNKMFPVGHIVESLPYIMVFKTTNWCWYNCPHCCESAGTNNKTDYIPVTVIESYINQACDDKKFSKEIVLTGGEITSAYMHYTADYVPRLLNTALDNKCNVDIKTNAGWAVSKNPIKNQVLNDLVAALSAHSSGTMNINPMSISLSLDRFHPHSLAKNTEFITEMSRRQKNSSCMIHVSSFNQDKDMFYKLLDNLQKNNLPVNELMLVGDTSKQTRKDIDNTWWSVGGNVLLHFSTGTLFDGGRAKDLPNAYHTPAPQFSFISRAQNPSVLMAFDTYGNVTLGENSGRKITVPWRNKDGTPRPLTDIRQDLVKKARWEEVRYNLETIHLTNKAILQGIKSDFNHAMVLLGIKKQEKSR